MNRRILKETNIRQRCNSYPETFVCQKTPARFDFTTTHLQAATDPNTRQ